MSRPPKRRTPASSAHRYSRSARVGELLREIIAEELERIGDERLEQVAVTSIDVDPELNRAIVYYDAFFGEAVDAETLEAFAGHRIRLQAAIGRQIRARKTPILEFRPDDVLRSAERIDRVLRDNPIPERDYGLDELEDDDDDIDDDIDDEVDDAGDHDRLADGRGGRFGNGRDGQA